MRTLNGFITNRSLFVAVMVGLFLGLAGPAQATIIYESATLGPTGLSGGGTSLTDVQLLGARFGVSETVLIDQIGGHIYGHGLGTLFGAIVSLNGFPTSLPSGTPLDTTEVLAQTTFTAPLSSADFLVPLAVTLNPGDYALVFGSGLFGATGTGGMPSNNTDIGGSASYFFWGRGAWHDGGFSNARFVVTGGPPAPIPEPSTLLLMGTGLLVMGGYVWRRERLKQV